MELYMDVLLVLLFLAFAVLQHMENRALHRECEELKKTVQILFFTAETGTKEAVSGLRKELVEEREHVSACMNGVNAVREELVSVRDFLEDVRETTNNRDDAFEQFLTGMSNIMNYSYEQALEGKE